MTLSRSGPRVVPISRPLPSESIPGSHPRDVEEVLALLRSKGGRATSSRRALLEILFDADTHMSAEDLAAAVQDRMPDVHISTVYRNLDELQELGVVAHSHFGHGAATFHLASASHAHLACERCGKRITAPDDLFDDLEARAMRELGFKLDRYHFALLGLCQQCQEADGQGQD